VIARIWTARSTPALAPAYVRHFEEQVAPELRALGGYAGARVLVRTDAGQAHVMVITWWQSLDAIRAFAGDALETAVVHDRAAKLLTDFDRRVVHYDVASTDDPALTTDG
jgi:heme-degrading monooxygenase HmoA